MKAGRWAGIGLGLALLVAVGIACSAGESEEFPSFVYGSALSLDSYRAAAALPAEVTSNLPCYCGCGTLEPPHRHLRDCFYTPDGSYNDHAASCDLCGRILLDAEHAYGEGQALHTIRAMIDEKYAAYGQPTDTPPVPR